MTSYNELRRPNLSQREQENSDHDYPFACYGHAGFLINITLSRDAVCSVLLNCENPAKDIWNLPLPFVYPI